MKTKKTGYQTVNIEIVQYESEDVITTSTDYTKNDNDNDMSWWNEG